MDRETAASYLWLKELPKSDNTPAALKHYRDANLALRNVPWPEPYDATSHEVRIGDARDLSWLSSDSVHLVVTSPPYWTLKEYRDSPGQMGHIADYEFLEELGKAWAECARALVPGGAFAVWWVTYVYHARKPDGIV